MSNFNQRYCVYGTTLGSRLLSGKEFLHSFLREDSAKAYIKSHRKLFPKSYPCYDVYVGGEFKERITGEGYG